MRALQIGEQIIAIARANNCLVHEALGTMVVGDAHKHLLTPGSHERAWVLLDEAGALYLRAGDQLGWGRTRIGKLPVSVELKRHTEAFADFERARAIFTEFGEHDRNRRLHQNAGYTWERLGELDKALHALFEAVEYAHKAQQAGQAPAIDPLGALYTNIGNVYNVRGELSEARGYYTQALAIFEAANLTSGITTILNNMADVDMRQGFYRGALNRLHRAIELAGKRLREERVRAQRTMALCYLALNRYDEARQIGLKVARAYGAAKAEAERARTLFHVALACGGLARTNPNRTSYYLQLAHKALDRADAIFAHQSISALAAQARLLRGQIHMAGGRPDLALAEVELAHTVFSEARHDAMENACVLLASQARHRLGTAFEDAAAEGAWQVADFARRHNVAALWMEAHTLLGHIHVRRAKGTRALRHFRLAAAAVERLQRDLTITLRPYFLEDRDDAQRALVRLYLEQNDAASAFAALDRLKSQVMLVSLNNRDLMRWRTDDAETAEMIGQFDAARGAYYQLINQALDAPPETHAAGRLRALESRIRGLRERLYLRTGGAPSYTPYAPRAITDVQAQLGPGEALVAYFADRDRLWALCIGPGTAAICDFGNVLPDVANWQQKLADNLEQVRPLPADHRFARSLASPARALLGKLHKALIAPLEAGEVGAVVHDARRLFIVPFGALHFVPFNLLMAGERYLIEQQEVVILPTLGVVGPPKPAARGGALSLAYSPNGDLPRVESEAAYVCRLFGGTLAIGEEATRTRLDAPPCRVLHIAAHSEHRIDRPELSFIDLADGPLLTDDLLQREMSYELVTLSACQTGLARVAGGDELIGLGQGFLYAGVGALVTTLWEINDDATLHLMHEFYAGLHAGASKAAALRAAQMHTLDQDRAMHPAFWGAFQLIGNADPLTSGESAQEKKTVYDSI